MSGSQASSSRYTAAYGPNVEQILLQASRVVQGRIPAQVRKELAAAVKAGVLGHLKKDGLKPEVFFHPDHKHGAIERQRREAEYAVSCIATVMAVKPVEQRVEEAIASLPGNRSLPAEASDGIAAARPLGIGQREEGGCRDAEQHQD